MTPSDVKRKDGESVEGGDVVVVSGGAASASAIASPAFEGSAAGESGDSFAVVDMIFKLDAPDVHKKEASDM